MRHCGAGSPAVHCFALATATLPSSVENGEYRTGAGLFVSSDGVRTTGWDWAGLDARSGMIVTTREWVQAGEETVQDWLFEQNLDAPASPDVGSGNPAFLRWFRFKEAYLAASVREVVVVCGNPVREMLDPFEGSGRTTLPVRMEGLDSTSVAVNPVLADVVRAKVTVVSPTSFEVGDHVYKDDARSRLTKNGSADLAILSPVYPSSLKYADRYNSESWTLGYFRASDDNRRQRGRTLPSHVRI